MATVEDLEERVKKIENILTLISREVIEQFDVKIKLAESNLTREIDTKVEMAQKGIIEKSQIKSLIREAEEIKLMFKEIREKFDGYELREEVQEIRSIIKVLNLRVLHIEQYLKKSPL
jgi:hypothetical protein